MNKLAFCLLVAVVMSALHMVRVQHEARRLFAELDVAMAEERRLDSERARLEVRVEEVAMQRLGMRLATPSITERVKLKAAPAAAQSGEAP